MTPPAQITICGVLQKDTIAALVELAIGAGAALMVQPRPLAGVVDAPARPALPPARSVRAKRAAAVKSSDRRDAGVSDLAVREFLEKRGTVAPAVFRKHFRLPLRDARAAMADLAERGVVELTGATSGRRVGLPGQRAKEAP